jgi:hypothetical protein
MWILIAIVLKVTSPDLTVPILDKPLTHATLKECKASMQLIYNEYKILQANYPLTVEYKINDNKQEYMIYSYKPDYTKPEVTTYYYCLKTYKK